MSTSGTSPAFAQDCVQINNDLDRLACYDQKSGRTPKADSLPTLRGKWNIQRETSEFKDTTDVFVTVSSDEPIGCNRFGTPSRAVLMLRCLENTTSLIINTDCHLASGFQGYGKVEYRIDDQPASSRSFDASTDNKALGLWSGNKSIPLIKQLFGAERLLVRFTPFNQSPVTAKFEVSGAEDAVTDLRSACNW
ncbi:type VI secretion system-associated protein TagO [Roseovarius sp. MMSF_3305]|uniref:type VI secretion system-associated protein TagO n=1 Tax=Roseovarius sp. MMSF_3305 TaxID=3046697 RepID=UPI00273FE3E1|nr:type VI secretion system-associated protein TagO [Roseovarius sp. MMSF_3305]